MKLMLRARFKAWCHVMWHLCHFNFKHRIWRLSKHWGFTTMHIFCDCGKEFK